MQFINLEANQREHLAHVVIVRGMRRSFLPESGWVYVGIATGQQHSVTAFNESSDVTWAISYTGAIGTFAHASFATTGSNTRGYAVTQTGGIAAGYFPVVAVPEEPVEIPQTFAMMQNYPNPFNPTTTLRYALPKDARVTLTIYNVLGQRVATLRDEAENVGYYNVVWNGRNDFGTQIASGVYFYRIEARPTDGSEPFSSIKKMLMLK